MVVLEEYSSGMRQKSTLLLALSARYGPDGVMATRQCVSGNIWAAPSIDQCRTVASEQFSNIQVIVIMLLVVLLFIYHYR